MVTLLGGSNGSGAFQHQHMQPAVRFNDIVSNVMSMIKISNGRGQGDIVSFVEVPISKRPRDGGNNVLLLGDQALVHALNRLESKGVLGGPFDGFCLPPLPPPRRRQGRPSSDV